MISLWRDMNGRGQVAVALAFLVLLFAPVAATRYLLSVLTLILYFVYVHIDPRADRGHQQPHRQQVLGFGGKFKIQAIHSATPSGRIFRPAR